MRVAFPLRISPFGSLLFLYSIIFREFRFLNAIQTFSRAYAWYNYIRRGEYCQFGCASSPKKQTPSQFENGVCFSLLPRTGYTLGSVIVPMGDNP